MSLITHPLCLDARQLALPGQGRIGVLTGGRSRERARSLLSGTTALAALQRAGLSAVLIDTSGPDLLERLGEIDVAFLAIAGQYAEDGKLQGLLEHLSIPYTGSGVLASALAMHKTAAKTMVAAHGVSVLPSRVIDDQAPAEVVAKDLADAIELPVIIKPISEGGSIDMRLSRSEDDLAAAVAELRTGGQALFAERFWPGPSITAAVLEDGEQLRVLPLLETRPKGSDFYDYITKNDPAAFTNHCPAVLPAATEALVREHAQAAHRALGCAGYSRSDFVVDAGLAGDGAGDGPRVWWLETNTLPGLSHAGNMATMAAADGIGYDALIAFILSTALTPHGYRP
ncbi:D-alanine--D-alanine ligase [Planobispora rosea]|uniref:D-alanine--D-alanine ligase n=1 Tax=Planobispora rosea TaxID=35762 RepID=A0A8J3WIJ3_PLARO|nr:D-alanine--D-alanine ligase [Planobispora rosea]GGT04462.1 D-alanine--D-alanine ligase [Planobispora rosea]GIH88906.1 D-alanine--D-alanine ligase [Planobispora rosea]